MADTKPQPKHWAVLIGVGINISSRGPGNGGGDGSDCSVRDRSLRGAVQDIISAAEYLKTAHGDGGSESGSPSTLDMTSLTATKKSIASGQPQTQQKQSGVPAPVPAVVTAIEAPEYLPTRDNVTSSFQRILKLSRPGDQVYIHYSGHGTKRKYDRAVALVLVNPAKNFQAEYLYGTLLRSAIHAMIEKGLSVTLVLDCCFSGRVLREDEGVLTESQGLEGGVDIRYMEHDPEIDTSYHDSFDDQQLDSVRGLQVGTLERLLDPDGYTILSACGPDEYASELEFEGGIRRGALSYFLLDSLTVLRKRGTLTTTGGLSHQELYQHLRSQFHACIPDQTPMLYGNRGFMFFFRGFTNRQHQDSQGFEMAVSAQRHMTDGSLVLNAGQAHGVHKGDEYNLTPSPFLEGSRHATPRSEPPTSITVRVEQVGCIRSRIVPAVPRHMERINRGSVWRARLVTALSPRKAHILLDSDVPDREGIAREAAAQLYCHFLWVVPLSSSESAERHHHHHHIHDASPVFRVAMNATAQDEYEIRDAAGKKLVNLPVISAIQDHDDGGGGQKQRELLNTLNHIAKYKFLEGIDNHMPCPSFEASFSLRTKTDVAPEKDGYYVIKHGEELALTFENLTTDRTLYLAIFTFTEFWQVRNLVSERGEDACMPVAPRGHGVEGDGKSDGREELSLMPEVPAELREKGQRQTEDVVKVFVTSQSTLFPGLLLPRLGGPRKDSSDSDGSRGDVELDHSVERFLKELTAATGDEHGGPWGVRDGGTGSGWTTRNYLVRTVV